MNLPDGRFSSFLTPNSPPLVNIGVGEDLSIRQLAETLKEIVGYVGDIVFDTTKLDGTARKLMDISLLRSIGWQATVGLKEGLDNTYIDFIENEKNTI
jgi:GDP-L-fucose synthase